MYLSYQSDTAKQHHLFPIDIGWHQESQNQGANFFIVVIFNLTINLCCWFLLIPIHIVMFLNKH